MGCRDDGFSNEENVGSPILRDALIFITMYMIGQPVDVHVKDGSAYTGIFCTASLEENYAIVLKNAMMSKKGSREVNIENGSMVDTLIVQGEDLVQVVAKGVPVPENGIFGGDATSRNYNQSSVDKLHDNMTMRQAEDGLDVKQHDGENTEYQEPEIVDPLHISRLEKIKYELVPVDLSARLDDESVEKHASEKSSYFDGVSTDSTSILHVNHSISSRPAKELKLNPEAKVFTPSLYQHVLSIPAIPAFVPGYILDPSLMAPTDASQPDFDVTEHVGMQSLLFVPGYMHQNSSNIMAGQMALPVYLPPLAHDAVSSSGFSQLSLPPLLAQYQAHLAKYQDHFEELHQT